MDIFQELEELGGLEEVTHLYPNAEIIDPDLAPGFIKIRGRTGAYEAAVKTSGMTYAAGDYVNVLYYRGTEPIVIGYGSRSVSEYVIPGYREPCRAISTTDIVLSGTQVVDGVSLVADDRILVNGQAAGDENGIYVVAAGAWSRADDADDDDDMTPGMLVTVQEGTVNADTLWILTTDDPITVDTTALSWSRIGHELEDLDDVADATPTNRYILQADGTDWHSGLPQLPVMHTELMFDNYGEVLLDGSFEPIYHDHNDDY
jgi:hypothetical protein